MSDRSGKRKSRRRQLKTSHQKNWLVGRYAVLETLRAGRWPVSELFLADDLDASTVQEISSLTAASQTAVATVSAERLVQLCHAEHHQGLAARMGEFPYSGPRQLPSLLQLASAASAQLPALVVICDRIQDAFNFGAILRCCDAMQVQAVIIGQRNQVSVTPQVARSSAGAVNHLQIYQLADLPEVARQLRQAGFQVLAASEKSAQPVWSATLNGPVAVVIGSEAAGIDDDLLNCCDQQVAIPMLGQVESLNAAVAAGILLYEIRRQQSLKTS